MHSQIVVSGVRVRQAREFKELSQEELASAIGVAQPSIAQIEADLISPNERTLSAIAMKTGFPLSFFEQVPELDFPLPSHLLLRARASFSAREKKRAHRLAEIVFEAAARLMRRVSVVAVRIPHEADSIVEAADSFRAMCGLSPDRPIRSLIREVERAGVLVFALPLPAECDGFSCWAKFDPADELPRPMVFVSPSLPGDRQNWTIAHEIGHLVLHNRLTNSRDLEEDANQFARELLLPSEPFMSDVGGRLTLTTAADMKKKWYASMQAIVVRAERLGIISGAEYRALNIQFARRGWKKVEPYPVQTEVPRFLSLMAQQIYGKPVDIRRMSQDLRLPSGLVGRMVENFSPREASVIPMRR